MAGASEHPLSAYMVEASKPGRTKRTAARLALSAAMRDGTLKPGDMLPAETELTSILGVSLGTVQAALRQLQEIGAIVRRRGDGSRVASTEPLTASVWHFRFISRRDRRPIHPASEMIEFSDIDAPGLWSDFLGEKPRFLRISRRYSAPGCSAFGADMYLDPGLVPGLADGDPDEWKMVNIRTQLESRYNLVVAGTIQSVDLIASGGADTERLGVRTDGPIYQINAETFGPMRQPIYFQRLFVPANDYVLSFSSGAVSQGR